MEYEKHHKPEKSIRDSIEDPRSEAYFAAGVKSFPTLRSADGAEMHG